MKEITKLEKTSQSDYIFILQNVRAAILHDKYEEKF